MDYNNAKRGDGGEKASPAGSANPEIGENGDIATGNVLHQDLQGRHMQMIAM